MKMRKIYICFVLLICGGISVFTEKNTDQSAQLLLRQKRLKNYNNSPESAAFYECYVIRQEDVTDDKCSVLLLDVAERKTSMFQKKQLFTNLADSKKMMIMSGASQLTDRHKIYKCVVLYTHQLLGTAIVNLFETFPITERTFFVREISQKSSFGFESRSIIGSLGSILKTPDDITYACYEQDSDKIILIDRWPNPSNFREEKIQGLIEIEKESYEKTFNGSNILQFDDYNKAIKGYEDALVNPKEHVNYLIYRMMIWPLEWW